MSANTDIVRSIEAAWGRNDLASLDQYFAGDFDNSQNALPGLPGGLAGAKIAHGMVMASFPDRHVEILDTIEQGNEVFVRLRVTGTNTGGAGFLGQPEANGAKVDFETWAVYELRDGKVVRSFGLNDAFKGMIQVGSLQPPM